MLEMAVFLERHRTNAQPACQLALHPPSGIHAHPEGANLGSMGMCSGRQGATPEAGPQAQHPPPPALLSHPWHRGGSYHIIRMLSSL